MVKSLQYNLIVTYVGNGNINKDANIQHIVKYIYNHHKKKINRSYDNSLLA